ncbi:hypothetical protein ORV05_20380 [Amycolatopsis cynarae]|uniref:Serine/threonine protein kinase n=1 Tax=Amycolatopsis cynarae TaxID=2995223 RepID=A0ABY7ATU9_9PSEU|nr:hypothetical protein [Amycolatopsis sp. HUAS 11-8]WAL63375.1 hypothetical protein ORV05_20380 [Amycolatopsis sp. HUAS 11-8]
MIVRRLGPLLAGGATALLTACSVPAPQTAAPALTGTSAGPASGSATGAAPAGRAAATVTSVPALASADGSCGSVTAASGLTLSVLDSTATGIGCPQAHQLVAKFQAGIAGQQPAGSGRPVSATVDGWLCVSGPPSSQGGTTCSLDDKTVYARVVAAE